MKRQVKRRAVAVRKNRKFGIGSHLRLEWERMRRRSHQWNAARLRRGRAQQIQQVVESWWRVADPKERHDKEDSTKSITATQTDRESAVNE